MKPAITVLMSVHNGMPFLPDAVKSILGQSFGDFEFLILNDGSTDGTADYLSQAGDARVRVISLSRNIGLTAALNHGLREAQGELIARQDADDVSDQRRLAAQHAFLQQNLKCIAVGTQAKLVDGCGRSLGHKNFPLEHESVLFAHLFDNALAHSAVTFRRAAIQRTGGYDETWTASQDYELWSRVSAVGELRNLRERLVTLRVLESSVTRTHRRADLIRRAQALHFERLFQRAPTSADLDLIALVRSRVVPERLREFDALLQELLASFEGRYPGARKRSDFRRGLAMLHERIGYNLLTLARGSACKELWRAARTWPRAVFSMPWARIIALGIVGEHVRRMHEKLAR